MAQPLKARSSPGSLPLHTPFLKQGREPRCSHSCPQPYPCAHGGTLRDPNALRVSLDPALPAVMVPGGPPSSLNSVPDVSQNSELFGTQKGHTWPVPALHLGSSSHTRRESAGNHCVYTPPSCRRSGQVLPLNVTVANLGQMFWFSELFRIMDKGWRACLFPSWVLLKVPGHPCSGEKRKAKHLFCTNGVPQVFLALSARPSR